MFMPEEFSCSGEKRMVIPKIRNDSTSKNEGYENFMPLISHELRSPITSVRSLSEILRDNPNIDVIQRQKYLSIIITETERLAKLVDEMLNTPNVIPAA